MNKRGFLQAILAAGVAPAYIGSSILMPLRLVMPIDSAPLKVLTELSAWMDMETESGNITVDYPGGSMRFAIARGGSLAWVARVGNEIIGRENEIKVRSSPGVTLRTWIEDAPAC